MNDASCLRHFFVGIILLLVIQTVFMLGGYMVEKAMGFPVTGVPSAIGLTLVLVLGILISRRLSEYVVLGSFTLAFLAPLILFLTVFFKVVPVNMPWAKGSLIYLALLTCGVWTYFLVKIVRGRL